MFSDKDLERLKKREEHAIDGLLQLGITSDERKALIERLEAAEKVCDSTLKVIAHYEMAGEGSNVHPLIFQLVKELSAWRKAAGRSE